LFCRSLLDRFMVKRLPHPGRPFPENIRRFLKLGHRIAFPMGISVGIGDHQHQEQGRKTHLTVFQNDDPQRFPVLLFHFLKSILLGRRGTEKDLPSFTIHDGQSGEGLPLRFKPVQVGMKFRYLNGEAPSMPDSSVETFVFIFGFGNIIPISRTVVADTYPYRNCCFPCPSGLNATIFGNIACPLFIFPPDIVARSNDNKDQ